MYTVCGPEERVNLVCIYVHVVPWLGSITVFLNHTLLWKTHIHHAEFKI